jgi:hypothetical protein
MNNNVAIYNKEHGLIMRYTVTSIRHYQVVRDYLLVLENGMEIMLDANVVKQIIEHEKLEEK